MNGPTPNDYHNYVQNCEDDEAAGEAGLFPVIVEAAEAPGSPRVLFRHF